ncbi:hypothetical protein BGI41_05860 [Methanobrevibacter sp. 87.7]|uniref:DUF2193 domain-containing protein n=1 Tax=Methanobrevibacter sp. 87.7 TaxID=387957 RepID=UPI000B502F7A|nr:DUF2193 domain-containing protein [Methanobrevibacter sp. 87.7]OWT32777.1 hypothetical protein BGI41_05860 [Methanobrevibacter sp. 87.7]
MNELFEKMVNEAISAQRADVGVIKEKRGTKFKISDAKPYLDAAYNMEPIDNQAQSVFDLHRNSVKTHYDTLLGLTDTVRPEDDPMVEHYQTPPVLEILKEEDSGFNESVEKFAQAIGDSEALISRESIRHYGGFYGPTCVVDFAMIPGSTSNVVNQILLKTDIPLEHKETILSSKSWGMNTSYGVGDAFSQALEKGASAAEATEIEIKQLQDIYLNPIEAQGKLMDDAGESSFDCRKYMENYKKQMTPYVKAAMDDGVHYGNIVTVPAYCVGDIAHHISQSTYNMCKDDVIMAVIEATTDVIESTLKSNLEKFKSPFDILSLTTGASACATEYMLELDGFNAVMVVDLLTKRFHNFIQLNPTRGAATELHNSDFMDMVYRGYTYLDKARKAKCSDPGVLVPMVNSYPVDLKPILDNEVIMNPQRYTYPSCGITVRFSSLMRLADYPCLLTSEPMTATLMTNVIALNKDKANSPVKACKNCASASLIDFRHQYCQWKNAI